MVSKIEKAEEYNNIEGIERLEEDTEMKGIKLQDDLMELEAGKVLKVMFREPLTELV